MLWIFVVLAAVVIGSAALALSSKSGAHQARPENVAKPLPLNPSGTDELNPESEDSDDYLSDAP